MAVPKYVGDSKMFEYDRHYGDCQHLGRPFVRARVNPLHGNYLVRLDMAPCGRMLSRDAESRLKTMARDEDSRPDSQVTFCITPELAWFDGITACSLDSFCSLLYDVAVRT